MEERFEIGSHERNSVEEILDRKDAKYSVSSFQRDYSWARNQWVRLWDDIIESLEERREHFFGFMTFLTPEKGNEIQIIEGQQRLATITILAAVIRDILMDRGNDEWKEAGTLITPKDRFSKESYEKLILSENNKEFFREYIQREGKPKEKFRQIQSDRRLRSSNRLIRDCYKFFFDKLKNEQLPLEILRKATRDFIVVSSDVTNLHSAYILFQTLNDRGLDVELLHTKLYILSKQQVLPLLLALSQKFSPKNAEKVLESLVSFIFRYLTIAEQENKELERLFNEISMKIREDKVHDADSVINELRRKDAGDKIFKNQFKDKQIRDNKTAVYILKEIEQALSGRREEFPAAITLEHILPVNPNEECKRYMIKNRIWNDKDELVYRIGNMTLLLNRDNSKGQNRSPIAKSREIYAGHTKLEINKELINLTKWTGKEINRRQETFAELAVQTWKL